MIEAAKASGTERIHIVRTVGRYDPTAVHMYCGVILDVSQCLDLAEERVHDDRVCKTCRRLWEGYTV